jgi:hypothetical protein
MTSCYIGDKLGGRTKNKDTKHGEGTTWVKGTRTYYGTWKQDKRCGRGQEFNKHGKVVYNGMWADDKYHGIGTLYDVVGRRSYTGAWEEGQRWGEGRSYYTTNSNNNMLMYSGDWEEDKEEGYGRLFHENGQL